MENLPQTNTTLGMCGKYKGLEKPVQTIAQQFMALWNTTLDIPILNTMQIGINWYDPGNVSVKPKLNPNNLIIWQKLLIS